MDIIIYGLRYNLDSKHICSNFRAGSIIQLFLVLKACGWCNLSVETYKYNSESSLNVRLRHVPIFVRRKWANGVKVEFAVNFI